MRIPIPSSLGTRSARRVCAASCDRFAARALPSGNLTPSAQGHLPMGRKPPQGAVMFPVPPFSQFDRMRQVCYNMWHEND